MDERARKRRREGDGDGGGDGGGGGGGGGGGCVISPRSVGRRSASPATKYCDEEGHYIFVEGEHLAERYEVLKKIGEGTFGKVLLCYDQRERARVAVKVVRNVPKYRDAAKIEIEILESLRARTPPDGLFVVLNDWFDFRGHICMVFEELGASLFDFVQKNDYQGLSMHDLRSVAWQLVESVRQMVEMKLAHTDLKPENILLVDSSHETDGGRGGRQGRRPYRQLRRTAIKLIDFGSATYEGQHHTSIVCTRHYRPPEVVLGISWDYPCDMWSVGCILIELYTGDALFQTHENLEHLALMEKVTGRQVPRSMVRKASRHAGKYFNRGRVNWPHGASGNSSIKHVRRSQSLNQLIPRRHDDFYDLLRGMLRFEPESRLTAEAARRHPFFAEFHQHVEEEKRPSPARLELKSPSRSRSRASSSPRGGGGGGGGGGGSRD